MVCRSTLVCSIRTDLGINSNDSNNSYLLILNIIASSVGSSSQIYLKQFSAVIKGDLMDDVAIDNLDQQEMTGWSQLERV